MNQQNGNGQNYQEPSGNVPVSQEPAKVRKSKKPLVISIVAIILAAILGVGGFFAYEKFFKKSEEPVKPQISEDPALVSTLQLYPDREVDAEDLEDFAETIKERISVLGETFEVTTDEEKITIVIEKALFGETAAERTSTVGLITSRGNINFGYSSGDFEYTSPYSPTKENISEIAVEELDRADLIKDYRLNFGDERYNQLDVLKEDTVYGLKVTFDDDGADAIEEVIEMSFSSDEPKLVAIHDFLEEGFDDTKQFMGTALLIDEDDTSEVYIVSPGCTYQKNADLMKHVLEGDEYDFGLVMKIADEPQWEVEGKHMGDNQQTEMDGETVIAEITPDEFTRSYNTEVDFAEYEELIKNRLDVLDIDYMFGTTGFDDKTYCVKVYPEDFAPDFFRFIFGDERCNVYSAFDSVPAFFYPELVKKDGTYALRLGCYDSPEDILAEYNIPGNVVYLVVNDVTVASADVTQIQPDDDGNGYHLDFTDYLCFGDITVSDDEKNVLELIVAIGEGSYIPFGGTYRFRYQNDKGETQERNLDDFDWKYEVLTAEDTRVFGILKDLGYKAMKKIDARNMLVITLDIKENKNLPKNFLEEVKSVYEACGFDAGAYNEIQFVIKDESKESPADKFRITARKDTYNGKMEFYSSVSGPKFSDYWLDVYEIMEEDEFYIERSW